MTLSAGMVGALLSAAAGIAGLGAYAVMIGVKPRVVRPEITPRDRQEITAIEGRLMRHVQVLAGEIGERNPDRPQALAQAAAYIRRTWEAQGFTVEDERVGGPGGPFVNLVIEQPGLTRPREIVLVGAHYDSILGGPGANDNGTGVAALLEASRSLHGVSPATSRTVRFVAFVNEEPPSYTTQEMGSRVHARRARLRGDRVVAMLSLETIGYYAEAKGSQAYPLQVFRLFYPEAGNFLAVVGNLRSRALVVTVLRHILEQSDVPVEGVATFEWIPGIAWSDHSSFWQEGYPALMLTDTAPFRYPYYHTALDLPDKITGPAFARAAHGIIQVTRRLAE